MTLTHAKPEEINTIYSIFARNKTWFPHIRRDYVQRQINKGCCIFHDNIIIIYNRYARKQQIGTCQAQKGDVILHQILNAHEGSGKAGIVLNQFCMDAKAPIWLSVRQNNYRAISFYLQHGFSQTGTISWLKGSMPGFVFRFTYNQYLP